MSNKLNTTSSGTNSNVAEACERCNWGKIQCLCYVKFTLENNINEYEWKGDTDGVLRKKNNHKIVGLMPRTDGPNGIIEPIRLDYEIASLGCRHPEGTKDRCSKFYYYEESPKKINSKLTDDEKKALMAEGEFEIINDKTEPELEKIPFHFNKMYLDNTKKLVPYYISTDDKGENIIETGLDFPIVTGGVSKKGKGNARREPTKGVSMSMDPRKAWALFTRCMGVAYESRLDNMPASKFHLAVSECKYSDEYMVMPKENLKLYTKYDEALAKLYVVPHYEAVFKLEINFKDTATDTSNKLEVLPNFVDFIKNMKIAFTITETFNGVGGDSIEIDLSEQYKKLKKIYAFKMFAKIMEFFELIDRAMGRVEYINGERIGGNEIRKSCFGIKGIMPKILAEGRIIVEPNDKGFYIQRLSAPSDGGETEKSGVMLDMNPLLGGKIYCDLIQLLLSKVNMVSTLLGKAGGAITSLSALTLGTDINYKDKHRAEAQRQSKWANATLIIYADVFLQTDWYRGFTVKSSQGSIFPELKLRNSEVSVKLGLEAGVSFEFEFWVIEGALNGEFAATAGVTIGWDKSDEGKLVNYIVFEGLSIQYRLDASFKITGSKKGDENKSRDVGGYSNQQQIKSTDKKQDLPWDNHQGAKDYIQQYDEKYQGESTFSKAKRHAGQVLSDFNKNEDLGITTASDIGQEVALYQLAQTHDMVYSFNGTWGGYYDDNPYYGVNNFNTQMDRMVQLNAQLLKDPNNSELLKERGYSYPELMTLVQRNNLPTPDGFMLPIKDDIALREGSANYFQSELNKVNKELDLLNMEKDKTAWLSSERAGVDMVIDAKEREKAHLEKMIKKNKNTDDVKRTKLVGPHFWKDDGLSQEKQRQILSRMDIKPTVSDF